MAFKMKGSPMKRNFGIGSGSPAKFQGAFIDGKRVSYDKAMEAIDSGEGNVELTNKEARKYAEEQGELDFINKVRKEDRKRIANMTPEERKEHRRLLSEDAARQANVDKLNYREGLGYKLTDKEKEERAGSTYDPETGEYSDDDLQPGVRAGSYEFVGSSPMMQSVTITGEDVEGNPAEYVGSYKETKGKIKDMSRRELRKAIAEEKEAMKEGQDYYWDPTIGAKKPIPGRFSSKAAKEDFILKQSMKYRDKGGIDQDAMTHEEYKAFEDAGIDPTTMGNVSTPMKQVQKFYKTDMYNKAFPKKKKVYKRVVTEERPKTTMGYTKKPATKTGKTGLHGTLTKRRPIEKAMKEAKLYKKEAKKVGMVRDMTKSKPKQVARKKARLVEKPKKKTGKISTKTMELE